MEQEKQLHTDKRFTGMSISCVVKLFNNPITSCTMGHIPEPAPHTGGSWF